jgi:PAS domain S-box-containing protein
MELLALLSNNDATIEEVKKALQRYTVYPVRTIEELDDLQANIPLNLVLIDAVSHGISRIEDFLLRLENDIAILITPEKPDTFTIENLPQSVYGCIDIHSIRSELPGITERAIEKKSLKNELSLLRRMKDDSMAERKPANIRSYGEIAPNRSHFPGVKYLQEKVLVNFAKILTVSFDKKKLFNHFMDSVMEIARVSKMSVMLRDEQGFYVKTQYGLDPYIADNLSLKKDSALVAWLTKTGRIILKPDNPADTASVKIKSEMELLQCTYSFPMIYKGKLIGMFNIDNKITEEPFYKEELEMIYMFCNYLAAAVKDIDLYNQILYQKEFTRNILSSMNSGVIAIDNNEKITIFNQKASEILDLKADEIMGRDLRTLPSPLGDILFETMEVGTSYKRYEVEVNAPKVPLGINSYRLMNENQEPIGAGIVFSDLTDSKKLEEQKRRAEKLEAINALMAKIAHEVRTPLTSIQTYTQLLSEKYGVNETLQNFFATTVIQSIHKLDSLIEKLVIFSSEPEYNFSREDINFIIDETVDYISKNIPQEYKILKEKAKKIIIVNVDRKLFIKALFYLILNVVDRIPGGTVITMSVKVLQEPEPDAGSSDLEIATILGERFFVEISIKYSDKEFTEQERETLLSPLADISNLGTELNIPISQKIIDGHEGTLEIKSEEGNNIFIVRLPVVEISEARSPARKKGRLSE